MTTVFSGLEEFRSFVGEDLGTGDWFEVTQPRIDDFAAVTEDHQWIHVDPERAAEGPYGAAIAHGYLTLSLIPRLSAGIYRIDGPGMAVNYGLDKVRFPQPVTEGARVRATARLVSMWDKPSGTHALVRFVVEIEGEDKPACVADTLRVFAGSAQEEQPDEH